MKAMQTPVVVPVNWKMYHIDGIKMAAKYEKAKRTKLRHTNRLVSVAKKGIFGNTSSSRLALREKFKRGNTSIR